MKRTLGVCLLIVSMIVGFGGGAKAAKAEVIFFQVRCVFPEFPNYDFGPGSATCSKGLTSAGVGTAFNNVANPAFTLTNLINMDHTCDFGVAYATFSVNGITGDFVWQREGTAANLIFENYSGRGFTPGSRGTGIGAFTPTTIADAQKLSRICHPPYGVAYNIGLTLTGVFELDDVN